MKILINKFSITCLFMVVFSFSHLSHAEESKKPESIVNDFYSAYLQDESGDNDALVKAYISDELAKSINDSTMCNYDSDDSDDSISESKLAKTCSQKHECKQNKGNYICDWYGVWIESDVNYFTKSQDTYLSWQSNINTSSIRKNDNNSEVKLVLGNGTEPNNYLKVSLKKVNGSWKITSVTE